MRPNQIVSIVTGSNTRSFTGACPPAAPGADRGDAVGVLKSASLGGTSIASYAHNGFGQRDEKTVGSTVTDLIYDRAGHLLAEANHATGAMIREYIWMDDKPVAMVDDTGSSPVIYFIHTDQVNRPQKLTDSSATIAWDGVFDPFGNVTSVTGSATMLLMFPGQYYDSETQLSQNWRRDYDPTIGRYVESDTTGLLGGVNLYVYVDGNPTRYVDPLALWCLTPAEMQAIASGVGGGVAGAIIGASDGGGVVGALGGGVLGATAGAAYFGGLTGIGTIGGIIGANIAAAVGFSGTEYGDSDAEADSAGGVVQGTIEAGADPTWGELFTNVVTLGWRVR